MLFFILFQHMALDFGQEQLFLLCQKVFSGYSPTLFRQVIP
ncbi:hypothetical protein CU027_1293 [Enterococcus faecium]|nr:hypothetical protein [Enterococcus faecium]